jgi:Cd2+/Zn2+-exporting ATPase
VLVEHYAGLATWQLLLVYLVPYLLIGHETLHEAWEGIAHGDAFNEHFLMSVATIGALAIGFLPGAETAFTEAVFVMLFFQVGELFEGYAEGQSRKSIAHLMDIRPDVAHVESADATLSDVSPEKVAVGSIIVIRPGEKVPLDGVIVEGATALNTVALTGESLPREVTVGDEALSGCVNMQGVIRVRTTKGYGESTVAKIISMVESAADNKSQSEAFITRFARVYTPIVVIAALAIAVLPTWWNILQGSMFNSQWIYRALMFLVVSCPCALVISVPLTFFGGIGGASRRGILIKGAKYMDVLAKVDTVVFDKTGTLTHGQFGVTAVHHNNGECRAESVEFAAAPGGSLQRTAVANTSSGGTLHSQLLHLAAHVEHYSTHPIGAALRDAFPDEATDGCKVSDVEEIAGQGIRARVGDRIVWVGNTKLMNAIGVQWHDCHHTGTIIHVAAENDMQLTAADHDMQRTAADFACKTNEASSGAAGGADYLGHIVINDQIKDDSAEAISQLKALGVKKTVMLTGDRREVADHVARQLAIDEWHAELMPADKVKYIDTSSTCCFVGDGINDAPVLARSNVGIAMGALGSDAAIEAADVVLMDDRPTKIATAIRIARRTLAIARQNIVLAIGIKVAVLILAAVGLATLWLAVFADVGVTVLAVLNAMRALR